MFYPFLPKKKKELGDHSHTAFLLGFDLIPRCSIFHVSRCSFSVRGVGNVHVLTVGIKWKKTEETGFVFCAAKVCLSVIFLFLAGFISKVFQKLKEKKKSLPNEML